MACHVVNILHHYVINVIGFAILVLNNLMLGGEYVYALVDHAQDHAYLKKKLTRGLRSPLRTAFCKFLRKCIDE